MKKKVLCILFSWSGSNSSQAPFSFFVFYTVVVFSYLSYVGHRYLILRKELYCFGGNQCSFVVTIRENDNILNTISQDGNHKCFSSLACGCVILGKISHLFSVEFKGHLRSPVVKLRKPWKLSHFILWCHILITRTIFFLLEVKVHLESPKAVGGNLDHTR